MHKFFYIIFFLFVSANCSFASWTEYPEDKCIIDYQSSHLEYAYGSCFKNTSYLECMETSEYRIIQNDNFVIWVSYEIIKSNCRYIHSNFSTSSIKDYITIFPYIKDNFQSIKFDYVEKINGDDAKIFEVNINSLDKCIAVGISSTKRRMRLSSTICGINSTSKSTLIDIANSLSLD